MQKNQKKQSPISFKPPKNTKKTEKTCVQPRSPRCLKCVGPIPFRPWIFQARKTQVFALVCIEMRTTITCHLRHWLNHCLIKSVITTRKNAVLIMASDHIFTENFFHELSPKWLASLSRSPALFVAIVAATKPINSSAYEQSPKLS